MVGGKLSNKLSNTKEKYNMKSIFKEKRYIFALLLIVIFSFVLYMVALTFYPISYGPDGPFYDIQVRYILRTGFPESNDGPLVYYYLVPFVLLTRDSYLGIKLGMSLIASLMAIPAFLLTEIFITKIGMESKIPALLAAFLISINVYCFRMVEDFMQNLAGVFFILFYLYYSIKWLEDIRKWKKYSILTGIFFTCAILTHVYTAGIVIILFPSLFIFNFILKWIKVRKLPRLEFFILVAGGLLFIVGLIIVINFFPDIQIDRIVSFIQSVISTSFTGISKFGFDINIFITIPFIMGLIAIIGYFIFDFRKKYNSENEEGYKRRILLSFQYLLIFIILSILILIPTNWQDRFVLLSFIPLGLIIPVGLKGIDYLIIKRKQMISRKVRQTIIGTLAIIFALSSLVTTVFFIPKMGPYISGDVYRSLQEIKLNIIPSGIVNQSGIVAVDEYHRGYWIEYILDMPYYTGNITENHKDYLDQSIYAIYFKDLKSPFNPNYKYLWFPILPYGVPDAKIAGPPKPPQGIPIFENPFILMTLLYYWNGTKA